MFQGVQVIQRFFHRQGDRRERQNFKRGASICITFVMLKEGLGTYIILVPKGIKKMSKPFCLSYVLEQESGQQRRTDVVMTHTLFSICLVLINRSYYSVRKFKFSRVAILSLPELKKPSILRLQIFLVDPTTVVSFSCFSRQKL